VYIILKIQFSVHMDMPIDTLMIFIQIHIQYAIYLNIMNELINLITNYMN